MDDLSTSDAMPNGAGTAPVPAPAPSEPDTTPEPQSLHFDNLTCKCGAPLSLTLQHLEQRIATLEDAKNRLENAIRKFANGNPMSKMMMAALPKDAQKALAEFFSGNSNGK